MVINNLSKLVLDNGGSITPLVIPSSETNGTGLMNPSIYNDNGKLILNLRHVNYTLYHCENDQLFANRWGPLVYLNPENDITLRTNNFFCELNDDLTVKNHTKVDTSQHDITPVWEFIGLEDGRLVRWNDKLYLCGVRRDVKTNGEGRMELAELSVNKSGVKEVKRSRIEPPNDPNSYCEKNWMPIVDMPFHFVKWTNPTEIVKVDPETNKSETVILKNSTGQHWNLRGGSHVIPYKGKHICIIHECDLWKNKLDQKDSKYTHRFVIWDKNWDIEHISDPFSFMNGEIEFCCGMVENGNDFLISFGFQDNAAYILKMPKTFFDELTGIKDELLVNEPVEIITESFYTPTICPTPIEQPFTNNLTNLPSVHYINLHTEVERNISLNNQFTRYNIKNVIPHIVSRDANAKENVRGDLLVETNDSTVSCTKNHLIAIKNWVDTSFEPYALFLEDDVYLKTSDDWNFTFNEFVKELPSDWDAVQLTCVRDNFSTIKLHERQWDDWSSAGYIITRGYAKRLLAEYHPDGRFDFEIRGTNVLPYTENILFYIGKTYTIPLFAEDAKFESTFQERVSKEEQDKKHLDSSNFTINWWKANGKNTQLKDLMTL